MHITKIEVGKTVPVGEGKNPTYTKAILSADLSYGEDVEACKSDLMTQVDTMVSQMSGGKTDAATKSATSRSRSRAATKEEPAATEEKPAGRRRRGATKEEPKEEAKEDTKDAKPARRSRTAKGAASKAKTTKKPKITVYDRTNKEHKAEVKKILNANFPDWDKDAEFKKATKATSEQLNGEDFIDADGNVMDSFAELFCDTVESIEV